MREAIVSLGDAELETIGFGDLVSHCRDAGIRGIEMLEDEGERCVPQVEVASPLDADLLAGLDCVEDWRHVVEEDGSHVYVPELTATGMPAETARDHDELVGQCDPSLRDRGVLLSLVGSQEAIREMLRDFETAGAAPDLHRLGDYTGDESVFDVLTDRQCEVLRTAYDLGFYDVPREASTEDVAAALDIEAATLSEHLQRAERNLLTEQLSS